MVDSSKGITNLHVPSDVIIDASMPAAIRSSGQMWGPDGKLHDMKAMIPDRCVRGDLSGDARRLQTARRVRRRDDGDGVERRADGAGRRGVRIARQDVRDSRGRNGARRRRSGTALFEHRVEPGDIWRMCRTRDLPIRDWVKLAVTRARATGHAAIFWLDEQRAYDRNVIEKAQRLPEGSRHVGSRHPDHDAGRCHPRHAHTRARRPRHDLGHRQRAARLPDGSLPDPGARDQREDAVDRAAARRRRAIRDRRRRLGAEARAAVRAGELPALGFARRVPRAGRARSRTSARRPATRGRWCWPMRSIGPTAESSTTTSRRSGKSASSTTAAAISTWRCTGRVRWPIRRGTASSVPSSRRSRNSSSSRRTTIVAELNGVQGRPVEIGGYYHPDPRQTAAAMRPSATLNRIIDSLH